MGFINVYPLPQNFCITCLEKIRSLIIWGTYISPRETVLNLLRNIKPSCLAGGGWTKKTKILFHRNDGSPMAEGRTLSLKEQYNVTLLSTFSIIHVRLHEEFCKAI